jgi:hypothetical protein
MYERELRFSFGAMTIKYRARTTHHAALAGRAMSLRENSFVPRQPHHTNKKSFAVSGLVKLLRVT